MEGQLSTGPTPSSFSFISEITSRVHQGAFPVLEVITRALTLGEESTWRVCYQRGLHCLVLMSFLLKHISISTLGLSSLSDLEICARSCLVQAMDTMELVINVSFIEIA